MNTKRAGAADMGGPGWGDALGLRHLQPDQIRSESLQPSCGGWPDGEEAEDVGGT